MQIETELSDEYKQTTVVIKTNPQSKDLEPILAALTKLKSQYLKNIAGYHGSEACLVPIQQIISFRISDGKVLADTAHQGTWQIKDSIKNLSPILNPEYFIQINQGEIVNRLYIRKLDLSLTGTIRIYLKDGRTTFVSRRRLADFKTACSL